jgi:hypothetical protein
MMLDAANRPVISNVNTNLSTEEYSSDVWQSLVRPGRAGRGAMATWLK